MKHGLTTPNNYACDINYGCIKFQLCSEELIPYINFNFEER